MTATIRPTPLGCPTDEDHDFAWPEARPGARTPRVAAQEIDEDSLIAILNGDDRDDDDDQARADVA